MIREAIDRILALAPPPTVVVDERPYSTRKLYPVLGPEATPLDFSTLTSLVDFIKGPDGPFGEAHLVVVADPRRVVFLSGLFPPFFQRHTWAFAELPFQSFKFGQWHDQQSFIVNLQTLFAPSPPLAHLLKLAGTMRAEEIRTSQDDGVTQQVTAKAGIALLEWRSIENPIELVPFRTFREVEQPDSLFLLRARGRGSQLELGLFEADGGIWRLEANKRVANFLRERLGPDGPVVLA